MRRTRRATLLATTLAALPLTAVGCGTATTSSSGEGPGGPGDHSTPVTTDPPEGSRTPREFATGLLARVDIPAGSTLSTHAPSKALDTLPAMPAFSHPPVVVKKFWAVDMSANDVVAWLKAQSPTGLRFNGAGSSGDVGSGGASAQYLAYRSVTLPKTIAVGDLYLAVISTGPGSSAIGAYAQSLAQPPRPAAEEVPLDLTSASIGWSLAPGGTPARKVLTGPAAERLARDFNSLRVDVSPFSPCPLIPQQGGDVVVTFTADGHTWKVDVPPCPDIAVQRDGATLPALAFGPAFLNDIKKYVGHLPQAGPPHSGGVIPLVQPAIPR